MAPDIAANTARRAWLQAAAAGGLCVGLGWHDVHAAAPVTVEFEIDLRAEIAAGRFDPARDRVGVRGAAAPLDWGRSAPAAAVAGQPGIYRLRLGFDSAAAGSQPVQHKFKIDRPGAPADDGWEPGRNRGFELPAKAEAGSTVAAPAAASPSATAPLRVARVFGTDTTAPPLRRTGHIDRIAPQASAHVGAREVQVWLPPGYASDTGRRYPVLYLHDGQNVFDAAAAGAEWQVDETAQRLVQAGAVQPMIIVAVAVASTGARVDDYTPVPARMGSLLSAPTAGGGAAAYGRYLAEELKPLIDARYRTRPGREHTALGGSSLGGLVSMWLLLQQPQVWGAALVVSPSVWWGGGMIVSAVDQAPASLPAPRLWIDVGGREGGTWCTARAGFATRRRRAAGRWRTWKCPRPATTKPRGRRGSRRCCAFCIRAENAAGPTPFSPRSSSPAVHPTPFTSLRRCPAPWP